MPNPMPLPPATLATSSIVPSASVAASDRRLHLRLVGDVSPHRHGSPPQALDLRHHAVEVVLGGGRVPGRFRVGAGDVEAHDVRSVGGEPQRRGAADPPRVGRRR